MCHEMCDWLPRAHDSQQGNRDVNPTAQGTEFGQLNEAGSRFLPQYTSQESSLADNLISACETPIQQPAWPSDLQNYKIINRCDFKLPNCGNLLGSIWKLIQSPCTRKCFIAMTRSWYQFFADSFEYYHASPSLPFPFLDLSYCFPFHCSWTYCLGKKSTQSQFLCVKRQDTKFLWAVPSL